MNSNGVKPTAKRAAEIAEKTVGSATHGELLEIMDAMNRVPVTDETKSVRELLGVYDPATGATESPVTISADEPSAEPLEGEKHG